MATFRKRNGKWQAIVRQKNIGTVSRSFIRKTQAIKWALEQEERIERGVFGSIEPSEVTLGELVQRYSQEITPAKRGAETELKRLKRLINDPINAFFLLQSPFDGLCLPEERPRYRSDVLVSDDGLPLAITLPKSCHLSLLK